MDSVKIHSGEHKDDWDDLIPPVMMAYRSSVHESTGFSPYRLMFGEECTLPMDIGLPRRHPDPAEDVASPYDVCVKDSLEVAFDQVRRHSGQAVQRQKRLHGQRAVQRLFTLGDWVMRYYPAGKKCKLDYLGRALSHSGHSRLDGRHSTTPGRASDIHSWPGCKEDTPAQVLRRFQC